ncbi:hypothetical protein LSAT2_032948, partial [Lamellibrachia satsuma]
MPKVKNGRKGGPPADRRCSTRATRVTRRLVDAAFDTDDLATVNQALRQQLQDVQWQSYGAQASSTQTRPPVAQSSTSAPTATASPLLQHARLATAMPILHLPLAGPSPVTPVPTTQSGTSALDSQGTDLQALSASAFSRWLERRGLGPRNHPQMSMTQPRATPITTVGQWLRAFSTYPNVYVERYPAEAPSMFTCLCRIMDMHKRYGGMAWRVYDDRFRCIHALMPSLP